MCSDRFLEPILVTALQKVKDQLNTTHMWSVEVILELDINSESQTPTPRTTILKVPELLSSPMDTFRDHLLQHFSNFNVYMNYLGIF